MMAHALGNPFDLENAVTGVLPVGTISGSSRITATRSGAATPCRRATLSTQARTGASRPGWTGTWGDLSTQSFYPPHHLTMGEGGAVNIVRDMKLKVLRRELP